MKNASILLIIKEKMIVYHIFFTPKLLYISFFTASWVFLKPLLFWKTDLKGFPRWPALGPCN